MAFNLTLTGAAYAAAKFANGLTGGNGRATGAARAVPFTIEARCKTTALNSSQQVACGQGGFGYVGMANSDATNGFAFAKYGDSGEVTISSTVNIADGNDHHLKLCVTSAGGKFFVDGVLVGTGGAPSSYTITGNDFGVGSIRYAGNQVGFQWALGYVDEVAIWDVATDSTNFTPPTSAYTGAEANLRALWHLDSDGLDSTAGPDGTAPTLTGAITSSAITSSGFTISWPAGSDNVGVVGYDYSTDGGATWVQLGNVLTTAVTGKTAGTAYQVRVRARDAAGNVSTPALSLTVTTTGSADATAPTLGGSITVSAITPSGFTLSWPAGADNIGVVGYDYSTDSGSTFTQLGNVLTTTVAGLASGTAFGVQVRARDAAGNVSTPPLSTTATTTAAPAFTDNIRFSPYNWNITSSRATSVNPGAYFSTLFTGATCTLTFDVTGETAYPSGFWYRFDQNGPWQFKDVAASVALDMTGLDSAFDAGGGHLLEVVYRYIDANATNRWSPQQCAMVLTGITLASGGTLSLPPSVKNRKVLFFGDSITEGVLTHSGSYSQDATASWAYRAGTALGGEFGIVGFASQGWAATGIPSTPIFGSTWNFIYASVSRNLTPEPEMIVINHGTNDSTGNVTTAATAVLNAMLAATTICKIVVMRPFNGNQAANLQAAVAAVGNARCTYLDTTGWYDQAANGNRLHPYANVTATDIAPRAINALSALLTGSSGTTPITNSIYLNNGRLTRSATGATAPTGKRLKLT